MIKIEKASVCFMSKDIEVAMAQHSRIDKSILTFEMVPYFAADRNGSYQSYSQLANETVDDSECEFMIFLNPKCVVSSEDLNLMRILLRWRIRIRILRNKQAGIQRNRNVRRKIRGRRI
jgi:hypothetical protein